MQTVTGFEDLDHGARGHVGPGLLLHPLVQVGVERLAQYVSRRALTTSSTPLKTRWLLIMHSWGEKGCLLWKARFAIV